MAEAAIVEVEVWKEARIVVLAVLPDEGALVFGRVDFAAFGCFCAAGEKRGVSVDIVVEMVAAPMLRQECIGRQQGQEENGDVERARARTRTAASGSDRRHACRIITSRPSGPASRAVGEEKAPEACPGKGKL